MSRIAPSEALANVELGDLGQGDRINLGVAAIMTRCPEVAQALGGLTAALRGSGTLPPRLLELVRLRIAFDMISSAEAWPFTAGRKLILFVGPCSGPRYSRFVSAARCSA